MANRSPGPSAPALPAAPRNNGNVLSSHCRLRAEDNQGALGTRPHTALGGRGSPVSTPTTRELLRGLRAARELPPMRIPVIALHPQWSRPSSPPYTETTKFRAGEVIPKPLETPFRWKKPRTETQMLMLCSPPAF